MINRYEGENYIKSYPRLAKWINQCNICQDRGIKPEMPDSSQDDIGSHLRVRNLRKFFKVLELDEIGRCPTCR